MANVEFQMASPLSVTSVRVSKPPMLCPMTTTARLFASGYFGSRVVMSPSNSMRSAGVDVFIDREVLETEQCDLPQRGCGIQPRVGAKRLPWVRHSIDHSTPMGLRHIVVNQMTQQHQPTSCCLTDSS